MSNKIKPKRSYTANDVPIVSGSTPDLERNEIAINWADSKLYTRNNSDQLVSITLGGGGGSGALSATVTIPGLGDPFVENVSLLLHNDGTGNTFVDSSPAPRTITAVGNATQSATQSKFGGKSLQCVANGYLSVNTSSNFSFGEGVDFTVELWAYPTETPNRSGLFANEYDGSTVGFTIAFSNSGTLGAVSGSSLFTGFFNNSSWKGISTGQSLTVNAWNHIAVTRKAGEWSLYLNGTRLGTYYNDSAIPNVSTTWIGRDWGAPGVNGSFIGFIDDVRVTRGVARYSGASLVLPTAAFPNAASITVPVVGTGSIGGGSGLSWSAVPASATATGTAGQIAYDDASGFLYVATATNTWKRTALSTWSFDPKSISGIQLWLDGDDAATLFDETTGGSLVAAGGAVGRWEDKSGLSRHATQATYTRRPNRQDNVQASRRALRFDGSYNATTSERMVIASSTSLFNFLHSGAGTVFVVASYVSTRQLQIILGNSQTASGNGYTLTANHDPAYSWDSTARAFAGPGVATFDTVSTNGAYPAGVIKVITNKIDATSGTASSRSRLYINGVLNSGVNAKTGAATSGNSLTDMIIGASENGGFSFLGDIAEIIIYNTALSDTDRAAVENYLISKWGIS